MLYAVVQIEYKPGGIVRTRTVIGGRAHSMVPQCVRMALLIAERMNRSRRKPLLNFTSTAPIGCSAIYAQTGDGKLATLVFYNASTKPGPPKVWLALAATLADRGFSEAAAVAEVVRTYNGYDMHMTSQSAMTAAHMNDDFAGTPTEDINRFFHRAGDPRGLFTYDQTLVIRTSASKDVAGRIFDPAAVREHDSGVQAAVSYGQDRADHHTNEAIASTLLARAEAGDSDYAAAFPDGSRAPLPSKTRRRLILALVAVVAFAVACTCAVAMLVVAAYLGYCYDKECFRIENIN